MDNITSITNYAYANYFNALRNFGYKSYTDVNKLLVLTVIEDLLTNNNYMYYITEDDYKILDLVLYCIMGTTCLIPYSDFVKNDYDGNDLEYSKFIRITLSGDTRFMELGTIVKLIE